MIRTNKIYPEVKPLELPREVLLTVSVVISKLFRFQWHEDYSTAYIKELLINDKDSLNSLLGLINYSNKYLEIFLEIITEQPGVNKEQDQVILSLLF